LGARKSFQSADITVTALNIAPVAVMQVDIRTDNIKAQKCAQVEFL
jgi:hypothetical protein